MLLNQGKWLFFKRAFRFLIINLLLAIAYYICVQISLKFSSLPGGVASVWFSSGMTLAAVFLFDIQVFPGIIIGSILALVDTLSTLEPPLSTFNLILLNLICAASNCLQPLISKKIFQRFAPAKTIFNRVDTVCIFIVAAIISPTISAFMGVTASYLMGTIPGSSYYICWLNWWLASALAHLLFTPFLLLLPTFRWHKYKSMIGEITLILSFIVGIIWVGFISNYNLEYLFLPILIWTVLRLGKFPASFLVSLVSLFAIFATVKGYGSFAKYTNHDSLIMLQSFTAVFSLTSLVLSAVIDERKNAQLSLKNTLANLEQQVIERTTALQQSEAQLDGFFSSAAIGMAILDNQIQFIRVNEILAEITGVSIADHFGKTVREIIPDLAQEIEVSYQTVIKTKQPLLNQELTGKIINKNQTPPTWLVSYFPIFNTNHYPERVGLLFMDITARKQLEIQLQEQALLDGLTQIANRRHFDEVLIKEWQRCTRNQQPLSLILCDVDEFKAYNDNYGHPMGDICLIQIAQAIRQHVKRSSDLVARYGGEEFAILLSNTSTEAAAHIANIIRGEIHQINIRHEYSQVTNHITLTMGIATCIPLQNHPVDKLIRIADQALYEGKKQGRDRIVSKILV
ncbi:PleD protein [Richelia sinica FACHB-800]|uniref:PleD protein n=1 Tax=Richelia sinica FACHB-800 TaxID=1357546 RepID=A0A975TAP6_9NOST|nr:diguanylate cyclase [Richelia sinica]MBD2664773.1 diguanylate cyclase [Richelia sinica FACHB-800]QXE25323.1 PleD protein [Richelia sinica FACHB-800]